MANKLPRSLFGALGAEASNGTQGKKGTANNIPVRIYPTGGSVAAGYITKQVGARRFKCLQSVPSSPPATVETYKIAEGTDMDPTVEGTMTIIGINATGNPVALKKLNYRTASDFSGNRYKWTLEDDSTQTLIILTAI